MCRSSPHLAAFITWERDPYLSSPGGPAGLDCDGYTTSNAHPYSRSVYLEEVGRELHAPTRSSDRRCLRWRERESTYSTQPIQSSGPTSTFSPLLLRLLRCRRPESSRPVPETFFRVQRKSTALTTCGTRRLSITGGSLGLSRTVQGQGQRVPSRLRYLRRCEPAGEDEAEFLLITPLPRETRTNMIGLMVAAATAASGRDGRPATLQAGADFRHHADRGGSTRIRQSRRTCRCGTSRARRCCAVKR